MHDNANDNKQKNYIESRLLLHMLGPYIHVHTIM